MMRQDKHHIQPAAKRDNRNRLDRARHVRQPQRQRITAQPARSRLGKRRCNDDHQADRNQSGAPMTRQFCDAEPLKT